MNTSENVQESTTSTRMSEQARLDYARQIKSVRLARGMNQKDLAEASGVGRGTIINIEHGKTIPQTDVLLRVMQALDMEHEGSAGRPEWLEGNLEIIANLLVNVPEDKRAAVLSGIFTAIIQATPNK